MRKPFGSRPREKGTRTSTGMTDTGRTAVGRAGSFNPEEPRSSRFRSYVGKNGIIPVIHYSRIFPWAYTS